MPDPAGWLSIAIVAATLGLILGRPHGLNEAWAASLGACAVVLTGGLNLRELPDLLSETMDVLLFLTGMMILTVIVESAGVFEAIAERCAAAAKGSGRRLFVLVFLLGAVITAFLSLDVTVIVLTPIVYAITLRRRIDPLPFMFGCTFVANTGSLVFPMSNLTNLLVVNQLEMDFRRFVSDMWLPNLVAVATNLAVFLILFRKQIPVRYEAGIKADLLAPDWWFRAAWIVLAATLAGLILAGLMQWPLSLVAMIGALGLLALGGVTGRISLTFVSYRVTWPVLAFVVGMLDVVRGLERQWLDAVELHLPATATGALLASVVTSAFGSNVVNNVPMTLLAIPAIERAGQDTRDVLGYGTLIGSNIGPTMTTYGSLATMLWLSLVRRRGVDISTREYLRVGILTAPVVLVTATLALWWSTR